LTSDYTLGTTITIPAGSTSASITLASVNDVLDENDETVIIDIVSVTNGTENATQQKTVTINDDDTAPTVTLTTGTATIAEASGSTSVTATLSAISGLPVTVNLGLTGTATLTSDYTLGTTITIPAGSTSASITLASVNDALDENDETIIIDIVSVTNATELATQQKTVTILDDDAPPTVTLSTNNLLLPENGTTNIIVTLSAVSALNVTITLGSSGTATYNTDYTFAGLLTIPAGSNSATVNLTAVDDAIDEPNETIIIDIVSVSNATEQGVQQLTYTLVDDDVSASSVVNLKLFIEGYYAGSNLMRPVMNNQDNISPLTDVENITVELRDVNLPHGILHTTTALLKTDGTAQCTFGSAPTGSFYIAVKTRNAIQTWSAVPITVGASPVTYNFTSAASKAFGNNMVQVGAGVYAFYSGDINQDEVIDNTDSPTLLDDIDNSEFGVRITDLNGDGTVDNTDAPFFFDNVANSIYSIHD